MTSHEAAIKLGFAPAINFVEVEADGSIGFTVGKPEEIWALYSRTMIARLRPSLALEQAILHSGQSLWSKEYVDLEYPQPK